MKERRRRAGTQAEKEVSASYHNADGDANLLELAALMVFLTLPVGLLHPGACFQYTGDNAVSLVWGAWQQQAGMQSRSTTRRSWWASTFCAGAARS